MSKGAERRVVMLRGGAFVVTVGVLVALLVLGRQEPSRAYAGMPDAYQAYWSWVGEVARADSTALEAGVDLLLAHPELPPLYLRLAEHCVAQEAAPACLETLERVTPPADVQAYHEAARLVLTEADASAWLRFARRGDLDPALARRAVEVLRSGEEDQLAAAEAAWRRHVAADPARTGALFGLGYLAAQRQAWAEADSLLRRVTRLAPDDPEAYRELGGIYYRTGQPERFEPTLRRGIEAAVAQHDLERELILRGNLGWGLVQRSGDLAKAAVLFEEAIEQSRLLADGETEGFNLYRLAVVRLRQHRYGEALELLDTAEERYARHVPRRRAEVLALRGNVLGTMLRFTEAEAALAEAMAEARAQQHVVSEAQTGVALAQLQLRMGRYDAALDAGHRALELAERYRLTDTAIGARIVLGDVEQRLGSYGEAEVHFREGLALAERSQSTDRVQTLYRRLGRNALGVRDPARARFYYERLLGDVGAESSDLGRIYQGLGDTYTRFDNLTEADRYYQLALAHLASGDVVARVNVLLARAWARIAENRFDDAEAILASVQPLLKSDPEQTYRYYVARANLALARGHYQDVLTQLSRADRAQPNARPSSRWHVLHTQALAHWRLGHLRRAEAAFEAALGVIDRQRGDLVDPQARALFVQNKAAVYENFAAFLEEQGRLGEAVYQVERARSRTLADLLYSTQRGRTMEMESALDQAIEMDRRLRALAAELEEQATGEAAAPDVPDAPDAPASVTRATYLEEELRRTAARYEEVQQTLASSSAMYVAAPIGPDSLQLLLRPDEAVLLFDVREAMGAAREAAGEMRGTSAVYVIMPDTLYRQPIGADAANLTEAVRFFRDQITTGDGRPGQGWQPTARRLYTDLLHPVLDGLPERVRHLHLIPEGVLHYVPFGALLNADGRFLVEQYTLSTAPSATVLGLSRTNNPGRWRSMLLLADPNGRLPGAREEVRAIASRSTARRIPLIGEQATSDNLEERAPAFDILHLATHGRFDRRAPWRSHLELHDGPLSVEEIGGLRLEAYLVTLSACETALSGGAAADVPDGDEWVGLNQAFLAAGTPTVMASLWAIEDAISSQFMIGFYDRLADDRGKAYALAAMQRRFIQQPSTNHPFYWAAFTVIGDPL